MNLNKLIKNKEIPFSIRDSYLVNFFIDEVLVDDNGRKPLFLLRIFVLLEQNNNIFADLPFLSDESYALVDVTTNEFKINNLQLFGNNNTIFSKILAFNYSKENDVYSFSFTPNDKDIFNICFETKSLNYEIINYINKETIKSKKIDKLYIFTGNKLGKNK